MLLSREIVSSAAYITKPLPLYVDDRKSFTRSVSKAVKFIIPQNIINFNSVYIKDISDLIVQENGYAILKVERLKLYRDYVRLPFKSVFLENDSGGILLESDDGVVIKGRVFSSKERKLEPYLFTFEPNKDDYDGEHPYRREIKLISALRTMPPDVAKSLSDFATWMCNAVCETILLINAVNTKKTKVALSFRERNSLQAMNRAMAEYHILDLYRTLGDDPTMFDAEVFSKMSRAKIHQQSPTKMHSVRGHFKRKKNGLFWWSPFVRCRKNKDTVGIIEKDYRLN